MIIFDTNVVSELIKKEPSKVVLQWLKTIPLQPTVITSITVAELCHGVALLPEGNRRKQLNHEILGLIEEDFAERILDFDTRAGKAYGILCASLKTQGIAISQGDAMIAAIALVHNATLATRNENDFTHCGIPVVNPFTSALSKQP